MQSEAPPKLIALTNALWIPGRILFSLAIVALGFETIVCARIGGHFLGPGPPVIPCLPWLPAIPTVAGIFGSIWAICGMGLFAHRNILAARALGTLLVLCGLVTILPKCLTDPLNIPLRTSLFQVLALACIAFLQRGRSSHPLWLEFTSRVLLGISLIVFGLDHFLALQNMAALLPQWIPSREIIVEVCGGVLVLGGLCVAAGQIQRWAPAALGLMFAAWVGILHLPRVLGIYTGPDAIQDPNEWSNLIVVIGLWGGMWTLVRRYVHENRDAERPIYAGRATGESRRRLS
jgi:uncharacterized membrane protein YphA (DoxX/SURF4 family)